MIREFVSLILYVIPLLIMSFVEVFVIAQFSYGLRKHKPKLQILAPALGFIFFILGTMLLLTRNHSLPMSIWITYWGWSIAIIPLGGLAGLVIYGSTKTLERERITNLIVRRGISVLGFLLSWLIMFIASGTILVLCLSLYQK
jgi:hypothetical protein